MSYTFQCYTQVVGDSFEDLADASFAARSDKVLSSSYHDGDQDAYGIPSHPEAIIPQNEAMLLIFSG